MSKGDKCGGSALFLVDLESHGDGLPGLLHGAEANAGPIHIVDTSPRGLYFGTTKKKLQMEVILQMLFQRAL